METYCDGMDEKASRQHIWCSHLFHQVQKACVYDACGFSVGRFPDSLHHRRNRPYVQGFRQRGAN
ncbi:hypothetical protein ACFPFV_12140 [Salinicoccus siamensis]|uniref:hypothetical protein n=1 Tax=Salinicoccus siamensis TaxID=381830 RepID=UPI00361DC26A